MIFIETPIFKEDVNELLTDDEYCKFQEYLAAQPLAGEVIQQPGGLRKFDGLCKEKGNEVA